jgi:hypothetical protein
MTAPQEQPGEPVVTVQAGLAAGTTSPTPAADPGDSKSKD